MTKLGFLTAAAVLIAWSPLAMAQSSNSTIPHDGSFLVAHAQDAAQAASPTSEQQASISEEEDEGTWQERNAQVPRDEE